MNLIGGINLYYGYKTVDEIDSYYGIGLKGSRYPNWMNEQCKKIQNSFENHGVKLTLIECKDLYETWSDEVYSASWLDGLEDMTTDSIYEMLKPWLERILVDKFNRLIAIRNQLK